MTTDIREGGADWELGEAARKLSVVLGVEGTQAEALRLALSDHAAAVGSKSTAMIAALMTPLLQGQQEARAAIADIAKQQVIADARLIQSDRAIQDWRVEVRMEINTRFDAFGKEFDGYRTEAREAWERLGGLAAKVEDHEVRIVSLETHGAPAEAVSELHQLRDEVGEIRSLLVLTRRQLWLTWIPVAAITLIFVLAILLGGGR